MTLTRLQMDFVGSLQAPLTDAASPGFRVYHFAYRARLIQALGEAFSKTWAWLGDEAFEAAARGFINRHPPHSWSLDHFGGDFPAFLDEIYPDDAELGELAWLEWALHQAFSGPDAEGLMPDALASADWDRARLIFASTLRLRQVQTNAAAIWTALAREEMPPPVQALSEPTHLLVWRKGLEPNFRSVDETEARAIEAQIEGCLFAELSAVDNLAMTPDALTETLGAWLTTWIASGLVVNIDY